MAEEKISEHPARPVLVRGILITLAGAALWGMNGTIAKVLMERYEADPLWIACFRQLGSCVLFLLAAHITQKGRVTELVHDRQALKGVFGVALGSFLLSQVAYLMAIKWTNSGTATVLQSLQMLICLAYVCVKVRRRPRRRELLGLPWPWQAPASSQPAEIQARCSCRLWGSSGACRCPCGCNTCHPACKAPRQVGKLCRERRRLPDFGPDLDSLLPALEPYAGT